MKSIRFMTTLLVIVCMIAMLAWVQYASQSRQDAKPEDELASDLAPASVADEQEQPGTGEDAAPKPLGKDSEGHQIIGKLILNSALEHPETAEALGDMLRRGTVVADPNALADFTALLNHSDRRLQLLGAIGLRKLQDPASKDALVAFLKRMDFANMAEHYESGSQARMDYMYDLQSTGLAILTLGKVGDESVIPLLESLMEVRDLKFEGGGGPVTRALAELGAIDSLTNIPEDADKTKIRRAAREVIRIRDPQKVPELMATARNEECARMIRTYAIHALSAINSPGVPEFLLDTMHDETATRTMRSSAMLGLAKSGSPLAEPSLLPYVNNNRAPFRLAAEIALAAHKPKKYLQVVFDQILDPSENMGYRFGLLTNLSNIPIEVIRESKDQFYTCLKAVDDKDMPADELRVFAWNYINSVFGERAPLELTAYGIKKKLGRVRGNLESYLAHNDPMVNGRRRSVRETEAEVDRMIGEFVTEYQHPTEEDNNEVR